MLVLSPSLGTTIRLWEPQLAPFAAEYRVLRHDHPGHGASPVPTEPVTVGEIAEGVLDLLDENGVDRASFCGLSLGAMVGMWLAARAPDRIERLTLCSAAGALPNREDYAERAGLVRRAGVAPVADTAGERWFTRGFRDTPAAKELLAELRAVAPQGYACCCEAVAAFDLRRELRSISAPTLVVHGAVDPVVEPSVARGLAEGIPGASRVELEGASHLVNVERPEAFTTAVLEHLRGGVAVA